MRGTKDTRWVTLSRKTTLLGHTYTYIYNILINNSNVVVKFCLIEKMTTAYHILNNTSQNTPCSSII